MAVLPDFELFFITEIALPQKVAYLSIIIDAVRFQGAKLVTFPKATKLRQDFASGLYVLANGTPAE